MNNYLRQQYSKYRVYPAYGGNEGSIYILNENQYLLLNRAIKDDHTTPMNLDEWTYKYKPNVLESKLNPEFQTKRLIEGMDVRHVKFGAGRILKIDDNGVASIKFSDGERRIILKYSKLEIIT